MSGRFRAPGRVNLIGEHTDYNEGFVLPAAIDLGTVVESTDARAFEFSTGSAVGEGWKVYVSGVLAQLQERGIAVPPCRLDFSSDLPIGAGLSSSAALEVSSALAFLDAADVQLPRMEIALMCQRAEIESAGVKVGIMDQFISLHGEAGYCVLLDCRSLEHRAVRIPGDLVLVIANTMVKHSLAGSEYNTRSEECAEAASRLGVQSLREAVDPETLRSPLRERARHVISENRRVIEFVEALESGELRRVGALMAASHRSLRDDYQVSCVELDMMVKFAQECPGLVGARMTGGGFGGSTINLVREGDAETFRNKLASLYREATGIDPQILITRAAAGASKTSR